jgi:hypothetical protein
MVSGYTSTAFTGTEIVSLLVLVDTSVSDSRMIRSCE